MSNQVISQHINSLTPQQHAIIKSINPAGYAALIDSAKPADKTTKSLPGETKLTAKDMAYSVIFILLLNAMTLIQQRVVNQSKRLKINASNQKSLNKKNAAIQFSFWPSGASIAKIKKGQGENAKKAAQKQNLQSKVATLRQEAQVLMTKTSTTINSMEQDASENSGFLKLLLITFQVINEVGKVR